MTEWEISQRADAIDDCVHALKLGENVLEVHLEMWEGFPPDVDGPDYAYWCAIAEIKSKLNTDDCLLKEHV